MGGKSSKPMAKAGPTGAAMAGKPKPTLHYFDVNGRGEVCKLVAAAGGLEIDIKEYPFVANGASAADKLKAGAVVSEHTKAATEMGMDGCGLPIVVHGDFKIYQSFACQNYLAAIAPNYPKVTPAQAAIDDMFQGALEDCMGLAAGVILSGGDGSLVPKIMTKVLTHLTKHIPDSGFVHGYSAPTLADICILVLTQALIPFGATLGEGAAACYGQFPKAVALGERTAAFPPIAKWLTNEYCCLKKPPRAAR
uniref:GST N-terminal domain-containing protein n=1 Tax=Pyramimonas obovata TaxID=1411642 RepID=A0A7S0QVY7_9CHLO|mmetsp:Transcript_14861/g.31914  ORF Transcript_14861/g.31914 Transcript_14861/m.31914 type:complete len:251 (+) Transcript_14861:229-981(+)